MEKMREKRFRQIVNRWKNIVNVLALEFLIWSNILKRLFSGQNGHFIWLLSRHTHSSLLFCSFDWWKLFSHHLPFHRHRLLSAQQFALFMATLNETLLVRFHSTIKHFKCSSFSRRVWMTGCLQLKYDDDYVSFFFILFWYYFCDAVLTCVRKNGNERLKLYTNENEPMLNNNDSLLIDECFRTLKWRAVQNEREKNTHKNIKQKEHY